MRGTRRLAGWLAEAEDVRKSDEGKRDSWRSARLRQSKRETPRGKKRDGVQGHPFTLLMK